VIRATVAINRYGGLSLSHAATLRGLRGLGLPIVELRGCAYPEMAQGEFCRQALQHLDELDVLLLVDPRASFDPALAVRLAQMAHERGAIVSASMGRDARGNPLAFNASDPASFVFRGGKLEPCALAAVPLPVLARMRDRMRDLGVGYFNSPFADMIDEPVIEQFWPLFTPFAKAQTSLREGWRLSPDGAFVLRALDWGETVLEEDPRPWGFECPVSDPSWTVLNWEASRDEYPIVLATWGQLDAQQQRMIHELEKHGTPICMLHDCPFIDVARDLLAERVFRSGFAGLFSLDHDIHFIPIDVLNVVREARERGAVVGVPYCMRKTGHNLIGSFEVAVGAELRAFEGGGVEPASYVGMGFTAIPRRIYEEACEDRGSPPLKTGISCDLPASPVFSLLIQNGFYAGEDVSFCARVHTINAREVTHGSWRMGSTWRGGTESPSGRILLDTRPRIFHVGSYRFGLEDASVAVPRIESLRMQHVGSKEEAAEAVASAQSLATETQLAALGLATEQEGTKAEHPLYRREPESASA
jgi:hypothetical protein